MPQWMHIIHLCKKEINISQTKEVCSIKIKGTNFMRKVLIYCLVSMGDDT
jgi:hypothetical protein